MSEQLASPTQPAEAAKKIRRSPEQLKAHYAARMKAVDEKQNKKDKELLLKLAGLVMEMAKRRPIQTTIGQAGTILTQAANAIQVPQ